jgi:nucleoside-diphosphate-sugar epimerase
MKVIVTGSTSTIGFHITKLLNESGFEVIPIGGSDSKIWKLGESFPLSFKADALIHLAHDRKMNLEENIKAVDSLVNSFTGYKLMLSSLSAHSQSKSIYGQSKFLAEKLFVDSNGVCLRAGIVFGSQIGGIYATLNNLVEKLPIIPVPFSGEPRLFMSDINDLCDEIRQTLIQRPQGIVFAANPWPISLRSVVTEIQTKNLKNSSKRKFFISKLLTWVGLKTGELIVPGNRFIDSLKSLEVEVTSNELSKLIPSLIKFRKYDPSLSRPSPPLT